MTGVELVSRRTRHRRKRLTIILLPVLIFIAVIGWLMYTFGSPKKPKAPRKSTKKDNVTLMPIIFEEEQQNSA